MVNTYILCFIFIVLTTEIELSNAADEISTSGFAFNIDSSAECIWPSSQNTANMELQSNLEYVETNDAPFVGSEASPVQRCSTMPGVVGHSIATESVHLDRGMGYFTVAQFEHLRAQNDQIIALIQNLTQKVSVQQSLEQMPFPIERVWTNSEVDRLVSNPKALDEEAMPAEPNVCFLRKIGRAKRKSYIQWHDFSIQLHRIVLCGLVEEKILGAKQLNIHKDLRDSEYWVVLDETSAKAFRAKVRRRGWYFSLFYLTSAGVFKSPYFNICSSKATVRT